MRGRSLSLLVVLPLLAGCQTHLKLRNNSVKTTGTLADLNYQQVLNNVAQFTANPSAMPSIAVFNAGTVTVTDQKTASASTTGVPTLRRAQQAGAGLPILQRAAQAAGAEAQSSSARDDRLFHVARQILAERAGMAHDLVAGLEQSLRGSLDGLRRAEPLAEDINASRADGKPAGLPVPDLTALHARTSNLRPWWSPALPPLADRVARRRLEDQFGAAINSCVDSYDRQLQAWARSEVERLVEQYELEAAPVREQVRRAAADAGLFTTDQEGQDVKDLEADLRELRPTDQTDSNLISSHQ